VSAVVFTDFQQFSAWMPRLGSPAVMRDSLYQKLTARAVEAVSSPIVDAETDSINRLKLNSKQLTVSLPKSKHIWRGTSPVDRRQAILPRIEQDPHQVLWRLQSNRCGQQSWLILRPLIRSKHPTFGFGATPFLLRHAVHFCSTQVWLCRD